MLNKNKTKKGFTLLELLIAVGIFVTVISASVGAMANVFQAYRKAKETQGHIDNAQYAMNLMMKSLRTSSIKSEEGETGSVVVFDYSRNECVEYTFKNNALYTRSASSSFDSCGSDDLGSENQMTSGEISGKFWIEESVAKTETDPKVGSVTVLMRINPGENNEVDIQSSVSLRDYVVSGIEMGI